MAKITMEFEVPEGVDEQAFREDMEYRNRCAGRFFKAEPGTFFFYVGVKPKDGSRPVRISWGGNGWYSKKYTDYDRMPLVAVQDEIFNTFVKHADVITARGYGAVDVLPEGHTLRRAVDEEKAAKVAP